LSEIDPKSIAATGHERDAGRRAGGDLTAGPGGDGMYCSEVRAPIPFGASSRPHSHQIISQREYRRSAISDGCHLLGWSVYWLEGWYGLVTPRAIIELTGPWYY
jgi:hypothetical protein